MTRIAQLFGSDNLPKLISIFAAGSMVRGLVGMVMP
jgi:hypothetical protein